MSIFTIYNNQKTIEECNTILNDLESDSIERASDDIFYPGVSVGASHLAKYMAILEPWGMKAGLDNSWGSITSGLGDGINSMQYFAEDSLGPHYDSPLWEYYINGILLPGYEGRVCFTTVMLSLSDPSEYEGGSLVYYTGDNETAGLSGSDFGSSPNWVDIPLNKGDIIAFDSTQFLHGVTPLVSGERRVLAAFLCGSP